MKKKEKVENLIYNELNAEKPNESVLNAAKMQMTISQTEDACGGITKNNNKRRDTNGATIAVNPLTKRRFATAICAVFAIAVILCCSLPFILRGEEIAGDNEFTPQEISSISNYDSNLLYLDYEIESSALYADAESTPVYILEVYNNIGTQIKLYVLLDTTQTRLDIFDSFNGLTQSYTYEGITVEYGVSDDGYSAAFSFNDYNYYITADVETDEQILLYVQELLN